MHTDNCAPRSARHAARARLAPVLLAAAVAACLLAGCATGGDDPESGTTASGNVASSAPANSETGPAATEPVAETPSATPPDEATSASTDSSVEPVETTTPSETAAVGDDDSFCAMAPVMEDPMWVEVGTMDFEEVRTRVYDEYDAIKAVKPPAEIADDWAIMVNAADTLHWALANLEPPPYRALEDYLSAADDFKKAQENITAYAAANCGGD